MSQSISNYESYESLVSYTIYETTHDGLVLTAQFLSRNDVNDYIDRFTNQSSYVHVYRTSCCDVLYPFSEMTTPMPSPSSPPTQASPTQASPSPPPTPTRLSRSTMPPTPARLSRSSRRNPSITTELSMEFELLDDSRGTTPVFVTPFSDMTIRKYGKGYVMVPPTDHTNYGDKYINDNRGWWNANAHGWFFKKNVLQSFLDQGAIKEI